jgi:CBS-domain-containing membrane protein
MIALRSLKETPMNAADVMSPVVIAVRSAAPLAQAVRLMIDNRISGLPVLDESGHAVGILTEGDLLRRAETGTAGKPAGWFGVFFRSSSSRKRPRLRRWWKRCAASASVAFP